MNDRHHSELSALFSSDSDALADEAFVDRCVMAIRRAQRRVLIVKLVIVFVVVGMIGLVSAPLTDLAAVVPHSLWSAFVSLDSGIGTRGRAIVIGVVLVLVAGRYGFPALRLR